MIGDTSGPTSGRNERAVTNPLPLANPFQSVKFVERSRMIVHAQV
jgi:hypothetical protein